MFVIHVEDLGGKGVCEEEGIECLGVGFFGFARPYTRRYSRPAEVKPPTITPLDNKTRTNINQYNVLNNAFTRGVKSMSDTIGSVGKAVNYLRRSAPYALTLAGGLLATLGFQRGAQIAANGANALRRARTENLPATA